MLYRGHVAQDILPYTCIYEHCDTPNEMYPTSDELLRHMRSQHSITLWVCNYCASKSKEDRSFVFESLEEWETHMHQNHSTDFHSAQLTSLGKASQRKMLGPISCPLCAHTTETFQSSLDDHIAQHLHGFALECLPWGTSGNERDSMKPKSVHVSSSDGLTDEVVEDDESTYLNVTESRTPRELAKILGDLLRRGDEYHRNPSPIWPYNGEEPSWERLRAAEAELSRHLFAPNPPSDRASEAIDRKSVV